MRALAVVLFILVSRIAGAATFLSEIQTGHIWLLPPVITYYGVLGYSDGTIYLRDPSGLLTQTETFDPVVSSVDDIVIGSADAGFVYLSGSQGISVQKRDPMGAHLTFVEVAPGSPIFPFRDPEFLAVPPDGTNLYATTSAGVLTYTRSTSTGELSFLDEIDDIAHLGRAEAILVSPDSAHVYVASDYLFAFDRSGPGGAPSLVATYTDAFNGYYSLAITADGLELYAGARDGIAHYYRNPATGELTFAGFEPTVVREGLERFVDNNETLNISADGTRLVGLFQSYMVAYDRDPGTGALSLLTIERNPTQKVTMSPDGVAVYSGAKFGSVYAFTTLDCTPAPASGCHAPAAPLKSALTMKDDTDPLRDKLTWRITPGGTTDLDELGNPITGPDDLVFCLYDASASPQPVLEAVVPARGTCDNDEPCWELTSSGTNLKYSDAIGMPSGVQKFSVRERAVDRGSIKLKAKSRGLALPALPLTTPVRAQLQSRTGACWDAVYSLPRKNDDTKFNAKSD
jgi:hypothetical protein